MLFSQHVEILSQHVEILSYPTCRNPSSAEANSDQRIVQYPRRSKNQLTWVMDPVLQQLWYHGHKVARIIPVLK